MGRKHSQDHNDNLVLFNNKKEQINGAAIQKRQKVGVDERIINPNSFLNVEPKTDSQQKVFESYFSNKHIVACGSAGTGKAQPLYCNVLTPSGWTTMGEINPGDKILAADGTVCSVVNTYPQDGLRPVFEITFHDGSKTRCDENHLWEVWVPASSKKTIKQVISLKEIIRLKSFWGSRAKNSRMSLSIDVCSPIELPQQQHTIPPYVLGALLGDGCITGTANPSFATKDIEILQKLIAETRDLCTIVACDDVNYRLNGLNKGQTSPLVATLTELGLYGTYSNTKFIPEEYINDSIENRWELIRGLFDTDGTAGKKGDITYSTTSKQMALQIQQIIWSLGGTCSISERAPFYKDKKTKDRVYGLISYTLNVRHSAPKNFFHLTRKRERVLECHAKGRIKLRRRIKDIKYVGLEQTKCILIDHPSHLYITDNYIVTHNTFVALYMALLDVVVNKKAKRINIIRSPLSVNHQGFLPGTLEEKEAVYERPYVDIVNFLFDNDEAYYELKRVGMINFMTTSYIRGLTWNDTIVIADEVQNMLWEEINTIATRCGPNTRLMFLGDVKQDDLTVSKRYQQSGINTMIKVATSMQSFDVVEFGPEDIVRDEFVKAWIIACELNHV